MLPFLAIILFRPQELRTALTTPTTPAQAWAAVRSAGYAVEDVRSQGIVARIVKDGVAADGNLATVVASKSGATPNQYPYLSVSIEIGVPTEVDPVASEAWVKAALPGTGVTFTPHLGRTVSAYRFLRLSESTTREALRMEMDGVWADARAFAAHYGGTPGVPAAVDAKRLRLDTAARLRRVDYVSLQRAFEAWGWGSSKRADVAFGGWWLPLEVGGRPLWARAEEDGLRSSSTRFTLERVAAKGTKRLGEIDRLSASDRAADGVFYDGRFHPRESALIVDLGEGLPLAELRRRVEAFAAKS